MSAIRTLRIYGALMAAAVRGQAQYRGNLLLLMLGGLAYQGAGFAFLWLLIERFGTIGGWTFGEILLLYAMRLSAHGFWLLFLNQLLFVDTVVREGEFDRYLVRPLNPLVQLMTRRVSLTVFGDFAGGIVLLCLAARFVDWSPAAVAYLVLAILGGGLVEGALQLAGGAVSFRLLSTGGLRYLSDELFNIFGAYPLKIFPAAARFAMTYVLPLAFVAYIPASVLLGRSHELSVHPALAYAAPLVGAVLMFLAYRLWRYQTRFYVSSGH